MIVSSCSFRRDLSEIYDAVFSAENFLRKIGSTMNSRRKEEEKGDAVVETEGILPFCNTKWFWPVHLGG